MKSNSKIQDIQSDRVVSVLYKLGLAIIVPAVLVFFFLKTDMAYNLLLKSGHYCSFKKMTGLYCPGCGGSRAVIALARLNFIDSFRKNAVILVSIVLYLVFMIWESTHRILKVKGPKEWHVYVLLTVFVITVVVRWIVCNIVGIN